MSVAINGTELKSGADVVVRTLEERGVTHVFGVSGGKIDKVFDSLLDSTIKTVVCRHEQNAAFIAGGIGRMTGKAGVALSHLRAWLLESGHRFGDGQLRRRSRRRVGRCRSSSRQIKAASPDNGFGQSVQAGDEIQRGSIFAGIGVRGGNERISRGRIRPTGSGICKPSQRHHDGRCPMRRDPCA